MKHADWCRSSFPEGFCNCEPTRDPRDLWHNVTAEELFKALIPGWKAASST